MRHGGGSGKVRLQSGRWGLACGLLARSPPCEEPSRDHSVFPVCSLMCCPEVNPLVLTRWAAPARVRYSVAEVNRKVPLEGQVSVFGLWKRSVEHFTHCEEKVHLRIAAC